MIFTPTKIEGVWIVGMERHHDERGWFARTWCAEEFREHGLDPLLSQCSTSFNLRRGTLRGMHYQAAPFAETKLVRCTRGAMFDVALDLRPDSPTFKNWEAVELSAENGLGLIVPEGCAHGFQTTRDDTEVFYMIVGEFAPQSALGARWNDPQFRINWPIPEAAILSDRDATFSDFPCPNH